MGWTREGRKGAFRYYDSRGRRIADAAKLDRIERLAIPPAWKEVSISPRSTAKVQATGIDRAGRKQYLYNPEYRAAQEEAKYDKLIRFGEKLPGLRVVMAEHLDKDVLDRERVSAIALRLIDLGWFRVGSERYAKESRTYGITTLRKSHVHVRGKRIAFDFVAKPTDVSSRMQESARELIAKIKAAAQSRGIQIAGPGEIPMPSPRPRTKAGDKR